MGNLLVGYSGLLMKMAVEMVVVAWIWKAIARVTIPKMHFLGIFLFAAAMYVLNQESAYRQLGHYPSGNVETSTGLGVVFTYLVVWTIISKVRKAKSTPIHESKATPLLTCGSCGHQYNPREYSCDAPEWFCAQCRKPLPRE